MQQAHAYNASSSHTNSAYQWNFLGSRSQNKHNASMISWWNQMQIYYIFIQVQYFFSFFMAIRNAQY